MFFGLVVTFSAVFMVLPTTRRTFQKHANIQFRSYNPDDFERQMESLKKEMEKLHKKNKSR